VVQLLNSDTSFFKTIPDRLLRKTRRVLETIEAFLFNRRDQPSIANDRRRRIPVISINP
jgi:hypothetical protein